MSITPWCSKRVYSDEKHFVVHGLSPLILTDHYSAVDAYPSTGGVDIACSLLLPAQQFPANIVKKVVFFKPVHPRYLTDKSVEHYALLAMAARRIKTMLSARLHHHQSGMAILNTLRIATAGRG